MRKKVLDRQVITYSISSTDNALQKSDYNLIRNVLDILDLLEFRVKYS